MVSADYIRCLILDERWEADAVPLFRILSNDDVSFAKTKTGALILTGGRRHEMRGFADPLVFVDLHIVTQANRRLVWLRVLVDVAHSHVTCMAQSLGLPMCRQLTEPRQG